MARLVKIVGAATPLVMAGYLVDGVARECGIMAVCYLCLGSGALLGFLIAIRRKLDLVQIFEATRFGLLPGFLVWIVLAPVLGGLGYEDDTRPRKEREAAIASLVATMRLAAQHQHLPYNRLQPEVQTAVEKLPGRTHHAKHLVDGLIARLKDPDPLLRSQILLAFGSFEGHSVQLMPTLETAMQSDQPRIRAAATVAMAGMRPFTLPMQERVFSMLSDRNPSVQLTTAATLRRIAHLLNSEDSKLRLRDALKGANPRIRSLLDRVANQEKDR